MLIDWFTVGAQALNFLILVWLMKRFLYQPILRAIDARETRIAAELADADAKRAEAQRERDAFERKTAEFDQQRAARLAQAIAEVDAERQRLLDAVRKTADAARAQRMEALRSDARNLERVLQRRTQDEVFAIARKTLADLASTSLEERMTEVFAHRLRALAGAPKAALVAALQTGSEAALVRSAFELPAAQRAAIQDALRETVGAELPLRFATTPDLVSGIEVSANGQKVAWSIADYLASLEKGVGEISNRKDEQPASDAPEAVQRGDERSA